MNKRLRRALITSASAVAVFAIGIGQADAHFCFKDELNAKAAEGVAGSANWISFADLAFEFTGLCPDGIEVLAEAGGVTTGTMINGHGIMAGGTLKKAEPGNNAISHLDFEGIDAAMGDAIAACE